MTSNGRPRASCANPRQTWVDPIQRAGEELVAGYQLIEEAWKKAEAKLALSHVPVDVRIKVGSGSLGDPENPFGDRTTYLGYVKLKNQWRICYIEEDDLYGGPPDEQFSTSCRPVTEIPVETRMEMFDWFEPLYNKVMEVTKSYVPRIKEKVTKFEVTLELIDL